MNNNGSGLFVGVIIILFVLYLIGSADAEPTCIKSGCDRHQDPGSSYCYLHKTYKNPHSSNPDACRKPSTSTSTTKPNTSTTTKSSTSNYSTSTRRTYHDTYDDGYEDAYDNYDYDDDRYNSDSDYRNGVDDAIDDMEEDGEEW